MGGERVRDLSDQFDIQARDPNAFVGVHGGKNKRAKRFNGNADTQSPTRTDRGQFIARQRVYEFNGIIHKTASRQKNAQRRQGKRRKESV